MTANEHLNEQQFSTWYHGTTPENARKIQREGLISSVYGGWHDEQGPLATNPTLARSYDRAKGYAAGRDGNGSSKRPGSVVEVRVPHHLADEYLIAETHSAGINKPLPPSMIHSVEDV